MPIAALRSFLALIMLISAEANAALITQVFEFDELGRFEVESLNATDRVEHFFTPFNASLGALTNVSIVASATSQADLTQFQYITPACTVEFPLNLVLSLQPGDIVLDEAGNFTTSDTGIHFGGLANIALPSVAGAAASGWEIDDFYTTPLHYLAFFNWRCLDCAAINDPLLATVRGSAILTYEYMPSEVPTPSTLMLLALGLFALQRRYLRRLRVLA